jgi:hypothetical protein
VDSDPPCGAIDARQPTDLNNCEQLFGWEHVALEFDLPADCIPCDSIEIVSTGGTAPGVKSCEPDGNTLHVAFDGPIPPGQWTRIIHNDMTPSATCLGFLPADVTGDQASGPLDIIRVIDCLNNVAQCAIYQCDINFSVECNAQDILGVINLLNGAGCYDVWNNVALPASPCACP